MILAFVGKMIDELLTLFSAILTIKNRQLPSAIVKFFSTLIFFTIVSKILASDSMINILLVALGGFTGKILSYKLDKLLVISSVWLLIITYKGDKKDLQPSIDELRKMQIDVFSYKTYHDNGQSSLSVKVISKDRKTSRIVKSIMPDGVNINMIELKDYK